MKKPNRRSKRTSVTDSSSPTKDADNQQQQEYERRVVDLEKENLALKRKIAELKEKVSDVSPVAINRVQGNPQSLHAALQEQVTDLKKKVGAQYQLSKQKAKNSEARWGPQDEIQRLKTQKVQLQCKMKLESVQFRLSKASLEKEVLQLKKEQRRYKYEMHKLLALNQRQSLVLQRKTEEASMANKRLYELLKSRKNSSHKTSGAKSDNGPGTQGVEFELKIAARVDEIRSEYERRMEEMADEVRKYEEEAETLREENFRFMLQDKEVDCIPRDSELRDLKDEVVRLSNLVGRMATQKTQQSQTKRQQVDTIKSSLSSGSNIEVDLDTSGSYGGSVAGMGNSASGACCSCSKKSLCKTLKCECQAAGGLCGTHCGCSTSKCTNRKVLSSKVDDAVQLGEAQNLVGSGSPETEGSIITYEPAETKRAPDPRRKPLREVGNTRNNPAPGQNIRKKKPVVQHAFEDAPLPPANNADGLKGRDEIAVANVPRKLTRATRAVVSYREF